MNLRTAPSPRLRSYTPTLIMAVLCLYFSFYLLFGPRGYLALERLHDTTEARQTDYKALSDTREHLEADVKLMRPNSLDPDMAEEQARRVLGYAKPDEVIIELR